MIKSKKINIVVAIAVVFALITSVFLVVIGRMQAENGSINTEPEYANRIFGTDIISIEIIADEDEWRKMLDNAINEEFIMVDVIVNGTKFKNVGIRPKGNSSLTQVASSESDRYSFRLQFDEYIKGQTCFGLESFVVNNMLGDNTYMKEYISYDLMREIGVDAPYFGYANIKVNGENWGLYLAVELYNDSYEKRVFGDTKGMLYNVKSMDMGGKDDANQSRDQGNKMPDMMPDMADTSDIPFDINNMPNISDMPATTNEEVQKQAEQQLSGFGQDSQNSPLKGFPAQRDVNRADKNFRGIGGAGRSSLGGSLEYTDDDVDSYSAIFNNVVGKGTESDYQRVIKALKALSEGNELESYFDVDKILRYLAAHTIVVNLDSYSSNMAQNYYIYERDGKITILPWDYNLAWGGFQNSSASSVINFPIDTPLSGVEMSSRPLIDKLFANTEYLERYHSYLQELINNYFANGKFEQKIKQLDALISEYVKNDATAFCTYDEYKTAVTSFIKLGTLRAKSVQGQLDGTVPSTTEKQNANPDKLISAEDLNLSDLGSMMGGKAGGRMNFPAMGRNQIDFRQDTQERRQTAPSGISNQDNNSDIISEKEGNLNIPTALEAGQGFVSNQGTDTNLSDERGLNSNISKDQSVNSNNSTIQGNGQGFPAGQRFNFQPGQGFSSSDQRFNPGFAANIDTAVNQGANYSIKIIGILSLVLISAIVFAAKYKKRY